MLLIIIFPMLIINEKEAGVRLRVVGSLRIEKLISEVELRNGSNSVKEELSHVMVRRLLRLNIQHGDHIITKSC